MPYMHIHRVDRIFKSEAHREQMQLRQITAVLEGLMLSANYKIGQDLAEERDYEKYESFFQQCFEVARRHKIMNPEKMRGEYGKLAYLLQDAVSAKLKRHLNFSVASGISTGKSQVKEMRWEQTYVDSTCA